MVRSQITGRNSISRAVLFGRYPVLRLMFVLLAAGAALTGMGMSSRSPGGVESVAAQPSFQNWSIFFFPYQESESRPATADGWYESQGDHPAWAGQGAAHDFAVGPTYCAGGVAAAFHARPMADGKVIKVNKGDYWLAIDHGGGYIGFYLHVANITVSEGDLVSNRHSLGNPSIYGGYGGSGCHVHVALATYTTAPAVEGWDPNSATWTSFPTLRARQPGNIAGLVQAPSPGLSVYALGVRLTAEGVDLFTLTDPFGSYSFQGVPPGGVQITANPNPLWGMSGLASKTISAAVFPNTNTQAPTIVFGGQVCSASSRPIPQQNLLARVADRVVPAAEAAECPPPTATPTATPTPSPTPAGCGGAPQGVTLYEHANYAGRCYTFGPGEVSDLTTYGLCDNVSSIRNNGSYHLTVFENRGLSGNLGYFDQDTPLLPASWNDTICSIRVELQGGVTLCDGGNYGPPCRTFTPGEYSDLAAYGLCDNVSSIRNNGQYHLTVFENRGLSGNLGYFDQDTPQLPAGWDNTICSIRVEKNNPTPPADTTIKDPKPATCSNVPNPVLTMSVTNGSEIAWQLDGGAWSGFTSNLSVQLPNLGTGSHTFRAKGRGPGGEDGTPAEYTWNVDVTPPTITTSISGQQGGGSWYVGSSVSVTASASDGTGCAGMASFTSKVDGGVETPYTLAIVITAEGKHQVVLTAKDTLGNTATKSLDVWLDRTPPRTGNKINGTVTVTSQGKHVVVVYEVTCDDTKAGIATSGCGDRFYGTTSTGTFTKFVGPVVLEDLWLPCNSSFSKTYSVSYYTWAYDIAGNKGTPASSTVSQTVSSTTVLSGCSSTPTPTPTPGCSIAVGTTSLTMSGGVSLGIPVRVDSVGGLSAQITLQVSQLPTGISGSFSPATVPISSTASGWTTLNLASTQPPPGQQTTVTISGTAPGGITCQPATFQIST